MKRLKIIMALLDERYPERNVERVKAVLYDAYQKSDKSLEDVIGLIQNRITSITSKKKHLQKVLL